VNDAPARWTPAVVAVVVVAAVVGAAAAGSRGDDAVPAGTTLDRSLPTSSVAAAPSVVVDQSVPTAEKTTLGRTLGPGVSGGDVENVQQRLADLGFDPGPIDGIFGALTMQSVWAFEKLVLAVPRAEATGRVTPEMWSTMQDELIIAPRRPNSTRTHMEIYLPEQVAIVFVDDRPRLITHISSGDEQEWCEEVTIQPGEWNNPTEEPIVRGECGRSITPGGVFEFYRRWPGKRVGSLGAMYNPVYFNYGIAVHGSGNVPNEPASHGCIRIPNYIADYFPSLVANGDQVFVFDGKKEPEAYGAQLPVFNWIDPEYSTTTSSTSSTSTTSVVASSTTSKPPKTTTTARPPSTTTTSRPPKTTTASP
jgi:hypothetical protein